MSDIIDLDALMPPSRTIHFADQDIVIQPPKTGDLLRLGTLGQKMQNASDMTPDEADNLVKDMTAVIYKVIPEINEKPLSTAQLLKLFEILAEMGMPQDAPQLKAKGIDENTVKKEQ